MEAGSALIPAGLRGGGEGGGPRAEARDRGQATPGAWGPRGHGRSVSCGFQTIVRVSPESRLDHCKHLSVRNEHQIKRPRTSSFRRHWKAFSVSATQAP